MIDIKRLLSSILDKSCITEINNVFIPENNIINNGQFIIFVIISFNRPDILSQQLKMLSENIENNFHVFIFDNSTDGLCALKNKLVVSSFGQSYLRLNTRTFFGPSFSHGLALNTSLKYLHKLKINDKYTLSIIDHDLAPLAPICISFQNSTKSVIGRVLKHQNYSYLWPGFLFFNAVNSSPFWVNDYRPRKLIFGVTRDTGADIPNGFSCINNSCIEFQDQEAFGKYFEIIGGNWLHLVNASGWNGGGQMDFCAAIEALKFIKDPD